MSVYDLPVFGPANVFPMMADDELHELAGDIRENGLREPLVIGEVADADGEVVDCLIDGRNRRAACKIAGVEPEVRRLNGEDPIAFVLSANIHRRHMTKGQRAMAVAMIYPEPTAFKRGGSNVEEINIDRGLLSKARTIIAFAPDLAPNVLAGSEKLDPAYQEARRRKDAANSTEARIAALRGRYPELADKVVEEDLTLSGALAEADARDAREREARDAAVLSVENALRYSADFNGKALASFTKCLSAEGVLEQLAKRLGCTRADLPEKISEARAGLEHLSSIIGRGR